MMLRDSITIFAVSMLALGHALWASPASAQEIGSAQPGFDAQVSVGYVLVPVIARTPHGYADRLQPQDFKLTVDGVTVEVESFDEGGAAPVTLLVLQDLSGSMANGGKLTLSKFAIERILTGNLPGDQYSLASFASGKLKTDVPFTEEIVDIENSISAWKPSGVTALHDAVWGLPDLSNSIQSARRAAILITDGADNASEIDPHEARLKVRLAELPVYVLGLATGSPLILDSAGKKLHRYADLLNLLAHQTGGEYFWISNSDDVVRAAGSIASDLRHQYVLGFSASGIGESRYRELEVTTGKKKVQLSFRRGYQGTAPRVEVTPAL